MPQPQQQSRSLFIQDTIQTFINQNQSLQYKLQHNISQLSTKNVYLSTILKQLIKASSESIDEQMQEYKKVIKTCMQIQDELIGLDALEKKTEILKMHAEQLEKAVFGEDEKTIKSQSNIVGSKNNIGL